MSNTLEILERLIGFETVSANPNDQIIAYISDFLTTRGARCTPLPSGTAGKIGRYAEIGPESADGILLSAHTDVVPTTGQNWTRPAFKLTREGERFFGFANRPPTVGSAKRVNCGGELIAWLPPIVVSANDVWALV